MNFFKGNYEKDADEHKGWFVGIFMEGIRKTPLFEIKYFDSNISAHATKISETLECTFVIQGQMSGIIDDKPITLKVGDYVVIPPGTPNNLAQKLSKDLKGFTIKSPSDPSAKKIIG